MAPPAPRREDRRAPAIVFGAVMQPLQAFFQMEAASGIVLLACAIAALAWVNLGGAASYQAVLDYPIALGLGDGSVRFTLHQAVNDGLMTVFFFVVGMEIKRELVLGELRTPAQAALPAIAALGGMAAPRGSTWRSTQGDLARRDGGSRWRRTSPSASASSRSCGHASRAPWRCS